MESPSARSRHRNCPASATAPAIRAAMKYGRSAKIWKGSEPHEAAHHRHRAGLGCGIDPDHHLLLAGAQFVVAAGSQRHLLSQEIGAAVLQRQRLVLLIAVEPLDLERVAGRKHEGAG